MDSLRDGKPGMKDFFVSYNRADLEWAKWLVWHLEEMGFSTIAQFKDFPAAQNFVVNMEKSLQDSHRMMAVLSPEYVSALYTTAEWTSVFTQDPDGTQGLLVPVRVREVQVPKLLTPLVYIDLADADEIKSVTVLADQLRGMGLRLGAPLTGDTRWGPTKPNFPFLKVDVLIEYCADDSPRAEFLASGLEAKGLSVYCSRWRVIGAAAIADSPPPAYLRAKCLAPCVGPGSLAGWANDHLTGGLQLRDKGQIASFLPVFVPGGDMSVRRLFPQIATWAELANAVDLLYSAAKGLPPVIPPVQETAPDVKLQNTEKFLRALKSLRDGGLVDPDVSKDLQIEALKDLYSYGR